MGPGPATLAAFRPGQAAKGRQSAQQYLTRRLQFGRWGPVAASGVAIAAEAGAAWRWPLAAREGYRELGERGCCQSGGIQLGVGRLGSEVFIAVRVSLVSSQMGNVCTAAMQTQMGILNLRIGRQNTQQDGLPPLGFVQRSLPSWQVASSSRSRTQLVNPVPSYLGIVHPRSSLLMLMLALCRRSPASIKQTSLLRQTLNSSCHPQILPANPTLLGEPSSGPFPRRSYSSPGCISPPRCHVAAGRVDMRQIALLPPWLGPEGSVSMARRMRHVSAGGGGSVGL